MNVSNYELGLLAVIRDEVNRWLKSPNFGHNPMMDNSMKKVLTSTLPKLMPGKSVEVRMNEISSEPFIMAIYPDIHELDQKLKDLVKIMDDPRSNNMDYIKEWSDINKWVLEIDARIFLKQSPICIRTGGEFVGILCHEIGHVMIEDPYNIIMVYKKQKARMDKFNKLASSKSKIVGRLLMPLFINTSSFRIVKKGSDIQKEIAADGYVPNEYRGDLLSYIEDCIMKDPKSSELISSYTTYQTDLEMGVKFSNDSMNMMRGRIEMLKSQLTAQYNGCCTGSTYHKELMKFLGKSIGGYDPETGKTNATVESIVQSRFSADMEACQEAATAALESTKVTDRDLSILEVECEDVSTTEDKIYLIHTIYDYIEAIQKENSEKLKKMKDPKLKEFLKNDARLERLNLCRKLVMNKHTTDVGDRYGLFIKYPKGYEG